MCIRDRLGAFNPLSRIHHEGDVAVEPWLFGEEAEKNVKAAIEMKYRLLPYIYTYAREAYETGLPIMRPMFMEYPADLETVSTDAVSYTHLISPLQLTVRRKPDAHNGGTAKLQLHSRIIV